MCLVAAALTHYFAAGAIVALALYAAIRKIRKAATPFAAAAVGGILLWGWEFFRQIRSLPAAEPDFLVSSDLHHSTTAALEMIGLCGQWLVGSAYAAMLPAAVMVILLVVTILWPLVRLPWRKDALLWLLWIGGTALPVAGSDLFHHTTFLEYLRYTILASPAAYALLASIDWPRRAVIRDTMGYCAMALVASFAIVRIHQGPASKEDWRTGDATGP